MDQLLPDGPYPSGALAHLRRADPVLAELIERYGLVVRETSRPPFYALLAAIAGQQISVKAAAAILGRLVALLPDEPLDAARTLATTPYETLRGVGLSNAKARYVQDLAEHVASGALDLAQLPGMDDEAVIATLTRVKGIGRWTAEMFLIFSLSRLDVLPVDDLGLRASIQRNYRLDALPKAPAIRALAEPWRPYRSIATLYFWESLHNTPIAGPD